MIGKPVQQKIFVQFSCFNFPAMMTRMAPTPSGFLHLGNMYNFILNWLWARANNGKVLLRIDDADTERKRKEYLDDIFRVLEKPV